MSVAPSGGERFLHPGEFYFGATHPRLRTVLGSCIAITLWHPRLRIGGMCHYMLPSRAAAADGAAPGLYADGVLRLLLQRIHAMQTSAGEYEVKVFGGARMFRDAAAGGPMAIGSANVAAGRRMLLANGFRIHCEDLGGTGSRDVIFDLASGLAWVRHTSRSDCSLAA